ncbi:MAG TPA: SDR family NAD(P)-dependent oxidoreductase [Trebonia sp.]|nr:SDR family NAD(P)-dependent oxidoreductase [Trebonia sp.]
MSSAAERVAIVTGGAGGLGGAIAARLGADGFRVAVADVSVSAVDGVSAVETLAVPVDVTDPASAAAMRDAVLARWGRIDVLVNNAGIAGPTAPVTDYPPDAWQRVIMVNLVGVFHCTQACLPPMIAAGYGRVVNIASIAGKDGNPDMSAYSASKAGVIAFTKSAGKETAKTGVLVNCVVPGVLDAGLTGKAPEEERRLFLSRIPMGRMGRAEELAELVSWLGSERCSFSTGATFDLSGGRAVY